MGGGGWWGVGVGSRYIMLGKRDQIIGIFFLAQGGVREGKRG